MSFSQAFHAFFSQRHKETKFPINRSSHASASLSYDHDSDFGYGLPGDEDDIHEERYESSVLMYVSAQEPRFVECTFVATTLTEADDYLWTDKEHVGKVFAGSCYPVEIYKGLSEEQRASKIAEYWKDGVLTPMRK